MSSAAQSTKALFVETSALVAIVIAEPGWDQLAEQIVGCDCTTSSFNLFEATLAVAGRKATTTSEAHQLVASFVERLRISVVPFTPEMIPHAVAARERFGRGRKGLNLGDCLSYAAAKQLGLKLLYKGDDFARTDVNA